MLLVTRNLLVLNGQKIRLNFLQILSQTFCYLELSFIPLFPPFLFYSEEKIIQEHEWTVQVSFTTKKKEVSKKEKMATRSTSPKAIQITKILRKEISYKNAKTEETDHKIKTKKKKKKRKKEV